MLGNISSCPVCEGKQSGRLQNCSACRINFHFPTCGVIPFKYVEVEPDLEAWRDGDGVDASGFKLVELTELALCGVCSGWNFAKIEETRNPTPAVRIRLSHAELVARQGTGLIPSELQYQSSSVRQSIDSLTHDIMLLVRKQKNIDDEQIILLEKRDALRRDWLEVDHFKHGHRSDLADSKISLIKEVVSERLLSLYTLVGRHDSGRNAKFWKDNYADEALSLMDVIHQVETVTSQVEDFGRGKRSTLPVESVEWTLSEIEARGSKLGPPIQSHDSKLKEIEAKIKKNERELDEQRALLKSISQ